MSICKNCYKYDVCSFWANHDNPIEKLCGQCEFATEASKIIELPCKIGDTLYFANKGKVTTCQVIDIIHYVKRGNNSVILQDEYNCNYQFSLDYGFLIGYKLFTTREEAEKTLKELNK